MRTRTRRTIAGALGVLVLGSGPAWAHNVEGSRLSDDGVIDSGKETHAHDSAQHGHEKGHLPPTSHNVDVVGKLSVADGAGRVADVSAKGNYAYLTRFRDPACSTGGVDVVDISDPAAPKHVSTIPSHTDTYSGEGSQVLAVSTPSFKGDVLIYNNEVCPGTAQGVGGVTLVDVTNPLRPKKLVEGFGDFTVKGKSQRHSNESHSAFGWQAGSKAYVVLVDNEEATDVDILDITNPSRPVFVSETDLTAQTRQPLGAVHGDAVFLHDMVVKQVDGRQVMLLSYWDGGYVMLDVTEPAKPRFLRDTTYPAADPVRAALGQTVSPEGNAHQAEFTRDNRYFVATDEDFDAYRVTATITGGRHAGGTFTALQGSDVPQISPKLSLSGPSDFVGLGCAAIPAVDPAARRVAVVERGVCGFTDKAQNAQRAGYAGAIIFNRTGVDGCDTLINMLVEAGIPTVFVSRTDGFRILGEDLTGYTCAADGTGTSAGQPRPAQPVDIRAVFDGWGYVHLYDAATMQEVGTYALPEGQDPAHGQGSGDLSVHEVATDPDRDLAYLSYYAGGFRVVRYGPSGIEEVGRFIDEGGNNFWGVEVHKHPNGQKYVLATDRDSGLYVFQYTGR